MPILQTRMMSLINAAETLWAKRLEEVEKATNIRDGQLKFAIQSLHKVLETETLSAEAMAAIESIFDCANQLIETILAPGQADISAIALIAEERAHFKARAKSNISAANYHRRKRAALTTSSDESLTGE